MHPTRLRRWVSGAKFARCGAGCSVSDCLARRAGDAHVRPVEVEAKVVVGESGPGLGRRRPRGEAKARKAGGKSGGRRAG